MLSGGTTSGCLQVGHFEERPANSGLTWSFRPQCRQKKEIMADLMAETVPTSSFDCITGARRRKTPAGDPITIDIVSDVICPCEMRRTIQRRTSFRPGVSY